jgi:hypothetical protein
MWRGAQSRLRWLVGVVAWIDRLASLAECDAADSSEERAAADWDGEARFEGDQERRRRKKLRPATLISTIKS